jgi:hypothetical protein
MPGQKLSMKINKGQLLKKIRRCTAVQVIERSSHTKFGVNLNYSANKPYGLLLLQPTEVITICCLFQRAISLSKYMS